MPGIPEFIATTNNEASNAKNPLFEDITSAEVPRDAPGRVSMAPMEEVEVEEEDPDVYFKRKRKGGPCRKRVVKKPRRHTPVIAESKSAAIAPPSALLVIKLSAQKQATEKAAAGLGNTSSPFNNPFFIYIFSLLMRLTC